MSDTIQVRWLGHSTFHITSPGGKTILIDPWLKDNPTTPDEYKDGFDQLDYMLITHGHFDHIGDAVSVGKKTNALVVGAFEIVSFLATKGVTNGNPMNKGGTVTLPGSQIKVTMTHADHTSTIQDGDQILPGGEPVGFVIEFENGYKIYNTGDTAVFGDMKLIGELYTPDLVMLPIGDHFTMGPKEAAMACRLIGAKRVIPQHYGTFPQLTGTVEALQQEMLSQTVEMTTMKPGEIVTLP